MVPAPSQPSRMTPNQAAPSPPAGTLLSRLARLWPYFRHSRGGMVLAALATVVGALTEPLIPALLKTLLDSGFSEGRIPLWMVPVALMGLFGVRGLAGFTAQYALSHTASRGVLRMRQAMFDKLMHAELDLFRRDSASKLSNTLVYEVQTGSTIIVAAMLTLAKSSLTVLALLGYLFWLNWHLTLIVLLLFPGLAFIMRQLSRRLYRLTRASQEATDELAYVVEENVLAHRMIRLHAAQAQEGARFGDLSERLRRLAMKSTVAQSAMTPLTQLLASAALSAVIAMALWQSSGGGVTAGNFVAFVTAMLMLITPIRQLAEIASPITRGLAALERSLELIENTRAQQGGTFSVLRARGELALHGVGVRYPGHEAAAQERTAALRCIDLKVHEGETVALVGPSGSGKSTLVNLLPRFLDPSEGHITLDGVALPEWDLPSLRRQFAMVSQDVVMLNDTLAANVALGEPATERDERRIRAALEAAQLGELLQAWPQGLDTLVGHNATALSGGQRQRLAIARAIYKDAPVLILDEATSALDTGSERLVQQALATLMKGRTSLVIAHRLSTIDHADRVLVLVEGQIVESGTPADLLARDGWYRRLRQTT